MTGSEATASIFDLDGVLTRADTMAALVSRRLLCRPHRLLAAVPLFVLAVLAPPDGRLRPALNRRIVALAFRGLSQGDYEDLARKTGRSLAARRTVIRLGVARCRLALLEGPTIVATASEATLARAFLDAAGLPTVALAASRLEFTSHGPRLACHNVGEKKITSVSDAGIQPGNAILYTDSASDLPLARAVRQTVVVNASRRSFNKLAAGAGRIVRECWR